MGDELTYDPEWSRSRVLSKANALVTHDRNATYGPPEQDFSRTAEIATALGFRFTPSGDDQDADIIEPHMVALFMLALKLSRLAHAPEKLDSWIDTAGYAACGADTYERTVGAPQRFVDQRILGEAAPRYVELASLAEQVANQARTKATGGIGPSTELPPEQRACKS